MAHLTIEIPDDLAPRLESVKDRLGDILRSGYQAVMREEIGKDSPGLHEEVIDFLASGPSPEEIIAFKPSPKSAERISMLLDKNRQMTLSPNEKAELDQVEAVDYFMIRVKPNGAHI